MEDHQKKEGSEDNLPKVVESVMDSIQLKV